MPHLQELLKSVQERNIPFHSFRAFALSLAREPETIDQGFQFQNVAVHMASFKNQVDNSPNNQVDNFAEANKKSAPKEADSSQFSFVFQLMVSRLGFEPRTT